MVQRTGHVGRSMRSQLEQRGVVLEPEHLGDVGDEQGSSHLDRSEVRRGYGGSRKTIQPDIADEVEATEFLGYDTETAEGQVVALVKDGAAVKTLEKGEEGWAVLNQTPFYAESGGQTGDRGQLEGKAEVRDTKLFQGMNLSEVEAKAVISEDDKVTPIVDQDFSKRSFLTNHPGN